MNVALPNLALSGSLRLARMARLARSSSACPPAYGENLYSVAAPVAQPANASIAPIANVVLIGLRLL